MFCPECKAEYREGFTRCADCEVALVRHLPKEEDKHKKVELVTIFVSGSQSEIDVIKSLLDSVEIPCVVTGADVSNYFGVGTLGTGFSPITGSIKILVDKEDAERALEVIKPETETD